MKKTNNILTSNPLILMLGVLMAFAIIFSPVLEGYMPQETAGTEKTQSNDDGEQESNETQLSTFDAVASAIQVNLIPDQEITAELEDEHVVETSLIETITIELPQKLFTILFRRIISPNAP